MSSPGSKSKIVGVSNVYPMVRNTFKEGRTPGARIGHVDTSRRHIVRRARCQVISERDDLLVEGTLVRARSLVGARIHHVVSHRRFTASRNAIDTVG